MDALGSFAQGRMRDEALRQIEHAIAGQGAF